MSFLNLYFLIIHLLILSWNSQMRLHENSTLNCFYISARKEILQPWAEEWHWVWQPSPVWKGFLSKWFPEECFRAFLVRLKSGQVQAQCFSFQNWIIHMESFVCQNRRKSLLYCYNSTKEGSIFYIFSNGYYFFVIQKFILPRLKSLLFRLNGSFLHELVFKAHYTQRFPLWSNLKWK